MKWCLDNIKNFGEQNSIHQKPGLASGNTGNTKQDFLQLKTELFEKDPT